MAELLLDVLEPLLPRSFPYPLLIRGLLHPLIAIISGGCVGIMLLGSVGFSFFVNVSRNVMVLFFFLRNGTAAFAALRAPCGHCICLVSSSSSLSKHWLVRRSASISSILACRASSGGRISRSPCWSCALGGLA